VPDWSRENKAFLHWDPARSLLATLRDYERLGKGRNPLAPLLRKWIVIRHRFWSAVTGADIPINCQIGGGLMLPHPNGVVIHPDATIGPNCIIFQQVTLGAGKGGVPKLGGHVDLGAGAKILGGVTLHDHCAVGANAVVLIDIPRASTAAGVPARVISNPANAESAKQQG
jgi:serine O-acetyltransferase